MFERWTTEGMDLLCAALKLQSFEEGEISEWLCVLRATRTVDAIAVNGTAINITTTAAAAAAATTTTTTTRTATTPPSPAHNMTR